jgi:hypothetical protein
MTNVTIAGEFIEYEQPKLSASKLAQALLNSAIDRALASCHSNSFTFTVLGKPAPQGSKRHVGKGVMIESSKQVQAMAPTGQAHSTGLAS